MPDGSLVEYLVDGQNRRVGKRVDGVTTKMWLWSSQLRIAGETDGNGALTKRFVYGEKTNVPELMLTYVGGVSEKVYRIITDQLGSPVLVVNTADATDVALWAEYDAFGNRTVVEGDGDAVPFGFAGGLYDSDTGLVRFGARDYDAAVGRWVSKDPIRWEAEEMDLYAYAHGDPVNVRDVSGRESCTDVVLGNSLSCTSMCYLLLPDYRPSPWERLLDTCGDRATKIHIWEERVAQREALAGCLKGCGDKLDYGLKRCQDEENGPSGECYGACVASR